MKRIAVEELLDSDSGTPVEIAGSLADLGRINRWFGGVRTTESMLRRVAHQSTASCISLLEVAAGNGYLPSVVQQRMQQQGIRLEVTLLDRWVSHLNNHPRAVAGDALKLPF